MLLTACTLSLGNVLRHEKNEFFLNYIIFFLIFQLFLPLGCTAALKKMIFFDIISNFFLKIKYPIGFFRKKQQKTSKKQKKTRQKAHFCLVFTSIWSYFTDRAHFCLKSSRIWSLVKAPGQA